MPGTLLRFLSFCCLTPLIVSVAAAGDRIKQIQTEAVQNKQSPVAHWGTDPSKYITWSTHSNRLIPVYAFGTRGAGEGIDLESYTGPQSAYRSEAKLRSIYGYVPTNTVTPDADYMDQTDVARIQKAAIAAGKKHVFLVVFDGFDWQTARAAAIHKTGKVAYDSGRGTGLHIQDYTADDTTQFNSMVTSPANDGTDIDVNTQTIKNPGGTKRGGYDPTRGGTAPWNQPPDDPKYLIGQSETADSKHAYTDSASSATSMTAGAKTYNDAINVDPTGAPLLTAAHEAQMKGYAVGVVTSVPISHATPGASYAHNVHRDDYQDLTRDLLGLKSISHPEQPLPGLDVLIGAGWGVDRDRDDGQGKNFVPGNRYLAADDRAAIDVANGGKYLVAERTAGVDGAERLLQTAKDAAAKGKRLFGYYGSAGEYSAGGNLPFATADGNYDPAPGLKKHPGHYPPEDLSENPTLAEMTEAALTVLSKDDDGFWLMVESGDVDWANHDNNLDASIGAVLSGDAAVRVITDWVENNGGWKDAVMIVTGDHGHYLVLDRPELLISDEAQPTE